MGKNITLVGGNGDGQTTKVANQIIVALNIEAVGEALVFASKAGADPAKVRQALMGGFAASRILEVHGERMIKRTFDPGFRIELHQKDLNLALQGARALGVSLPNTATCQELFNACAATRRRGLGSFRHGHGAGDAGQPSRSARSLGLRRRGRWTPRQLLRRHVRRRDRGGLPRRGCCRRTCPTPPTGRTVVVGAGKARPRWRRRSRRIGRRRAARGPGRHPLRPRRRRCKRIEVVEAAHPVPDDGGPEPRPQRILELVAGPERRTIWCCA